MQDLVTLRGQVSFATGINYSGQIVGLSWTGGREHAFLWQSGKGMQDLGPHGSERSSAAGINDSGQVAGWYGGYDAYQAALWQNDGSVQNLGTLGGNSSALDINNIGQVAGSSDTSGRPRAFLWQSGKGMQDLGTLIDSTVVPERPPFPGTASWATALNDRGEVVGWSFSASGEIHAFLWISGSGMQDLGTLGGSYSSASDINNNRQVVGEHLRPAGSARSCPVANRWWT